MKNLWFETGVNVVIWYSIVLLLIKIMELAHLVDLSFLI